MRAALYCISCAPDVAASEVSLRGERPVLPPSLWAATAIPAPILAPLSGDQKADVAIIGAGFLGLSTALHLAEHGVKITVIDAAQPGWGASGRNNGQVIPGLKHDPDEVEALLGHEIGSRLVAWSGAAPDLVFDLIERHGIACHPVRKGWIQPAYAKAAVATIESRCAQWAARGAAVRMLDASEWPAMLGTAAFHGAWLDMRGGSIQPLSYARGLAHAAVAAGITIHDRSAVRAVTHAGREWRIETDAGSVTAPRAVIATNAYGDILPELRRAIVPVRTAQVATRPLSANILATILPGRQLASDTRRLLTSFRISPDGRLVMGGSGATGGAHHASLERHLHKSARELFGHLGELEWEFGWSGYLALTVDHMPHIYEPREGLIAGIGCNGRGIAISTALGKLIAQRILGRRADELEVPIATAAPFAFHGFSRIGIALATTWKRMQDRQERRGLLG